MAGIRVFARSVFAASLFLAAAGARAQEPPPTAAPQPVVGEASPAPSAASSPTRLFFAPTARSLPASAGSAGLTEIVFPWGEVGLSGRFSVFGAVIPPFEGGTSVGIILGPKVQLVRRNGVLAAAGVYQGLAPGWSGGVGYGVVTLGSADTAVTLGYGYGYGGLVDPGESASIVFAGAEKSLGRRFRLVFEGLFGGAGLGLPDQTLIGAARIGGSRWAVDVGVLVPVYETGAGTPFPLLTIAYRHPARR